MAHTLPHLVPFPSSAWREHLAPPDWEATLQSWVSLTSAHLARSDSDFARLSAKDETLSAFLESFMQEVASGSTSILGPSPAAKTLLRDSYLLSVRLFGLTSPPFALLHWSFLADFSKVYSKPRVGPTISAVFASSRTPEASLTTLKRGLIRDLDLGAGGDLPSLAARLSRLSHLLHASPAVAAFFLAGSDFLDGLLGCFRTADAALRQAIVAALYLCLVGVVEGDAGGGGKAASSSLLADQLWALDAAAKAHRAGPRDGEDSLVVELVSSTPVVRQLRDGLARTGAPNARVDSVLTSLEGFRRGGAARKRKTAKEGKGKGVAKGTEFAEEDRQIHVHKLSKITQVQDLFPDLGSGFVAKLLDAYDEDAEQVVAHLLEGSLPKHLESADKSEELPMPPHSSLPPRYTPPPTDLHPRRNIHDFDALDRLSVSTSQLHIGKRGGDAASADALLADSSASRPEAKAAILSALAAFDADDDERDDTYDAADVGGAIVDGSAAAASEGVVRVTNDGGGGQAGGAGGEDDDITPVDEALYRAWAANPRLFDRDAATRRGAERRRLREEVGGGMTDEAVEGWAIMLGRSAARRRRLEARVMGLGGAGGAGFTGRQTELVSTAWRAGEGEGEDGGEADGGAGGRGGPRGGWRGRGGRGGRGGGRGGGDVAGATGEKETEAARRRKEQNKGSRANHNRRDQRARKMARGGFPG